MRFGFGCCVRASFLHGCRLRVVVEWDFLDFCCAYCNIRCGSLALENGCGICYDFLSVLVPFGFKVWRFVESQ